MSSVNMERTHLVVSYDPFVPFQLLFWILLGLLVLRAGNNSRCLAQEAGSPNLLQYG
jgi:hypothetical protein